MGLARPLRGVRAEAEPVKTRVLEHDPGDFAVRERSAEGAFSDERREVREDHPRRVLVSKQVLEFFRGKLRGADVRGDLELLGRGHDGVPDRHAHPVLGQSPPVEHRRAAAVARREGQKQGVRRRRRRRVAPRRRRAQRRRHRRAQTRDRREGRRLRDLDEYEFREKFREKFREHAVLRRGHHGDPQRPDFGDPRRRRHRRRARRFGRRAVPAERRVPAHGRVAYAAQPQGVGELELPERRRARHEVRERERLRDVLGESASEPPERRAGCFRYAQPASPAERRNGGAQGDFGASAVRRRRHRGADFDQRNAGLAERVVRGRVVRVRVPRGRDQIRGGRRGGYAG
mmetsp:Transcript_1925/g.7991  ORF Transcript_1925/g.7991 Transcript_1925/m.7991 type:complete len:345 (-) Transcript_1925:3517-4551(-)